MDWIETKLELSVEDLKRDKQFIESILRKSEEMNTSVEKTSKIDDLRQELSVLCEQIKERVENDKQMSCFKRRNSSDNLVMDLNSIRSKSISDPKESEENESSDEGIVNVNQLKEKLRKQSRDLCHQIRRRLDNSQGLTQNKITKVFEDLQKTDTLLRDNGTDVKTLEKQISHLESNFFNF